MVDVVIGLVIVESFQGLKQQCVRAGAAAVARDLQVERRVGGQSNDLAEVGSRLDRFCFFFFRFTRGASMVSFFEGSSDPRRSNRRLLQS